MSNKRAVSKAEKIIGIISKIIVFVLILLTLAMLITAFIKTNVVPAIAYNKAEKLLEDGMYEQAIDAFAALDYKDSADRVYDCKYEQAKDAISKEDYGTAQSRFAEIAQKLEYSESAVAGFDFHSDVKDEHLYLRAVKHLEMGENLAAENFLKNVSEDYKDTAELIKEARYLRGCEILENGTENTKYANTVSAVISIYGENAKTEDATVGEEASTDGFRFKYKHLDKAIDIFSSLGNYKDSAEKLNEAETGKKDIIYNEAVVLLDEKNYISAKELLNMIPDYKDATELLEYYAPEFSFYKLISGDVVYFGHIEQDGLAETQNEAIRWTVTNKTTDGNAILLVADDTLKVLPYEESGEDKKWEETTLYAYLNNSFIYTAFTEPERLALRDFEVNIPSRDDVYYEMDDCISYLTPASIISALDLSDAVDERYTDTLMTSKWWVRPSSGTYARYAHDSSIYTSYYPEDHRGVRPAIWVTPDMMRLCTVEQ